MNLFFCENISQPTSFLNEEESHHCVRVLRMNSGDQISIFDGNGTQAIGKILVATKKRVEFEVDSVKSTKEPANSLHIAIAPTKSNDRTELFLEKATELGVTEITFIETYNSERRSINIDRFRKIVMSAAKQSLSAFLPKVNDLIHLNEFLRTMQCDKKYIATLIESNNNFSEFKSVNNNSLVLVGPEGGFNKEEVEMAIQNAYLPILIGPKRLRTETAGIAIALTSYLKEV